MTFDPPFGPVDPRLLVALLRRQMEAPGLVPGPVPTVTPAPGYRPPAGGLGGMPMPPPVPGFNLMSGFDALSEGLSRWKPRVPTAPVPTKPGVPTPLGAVDPPTMLDLWDRQWRAFRG